MARRTISGNYYGRDYSAGTEKGAALFLPNVNAGTAMIIWAPVFHFYQPPTQFPAVLKRPEAEDLSRRVRQHLLAA